MTFKRLLQLLDFKRTILLEEQAQALCVSSRALVAVAQSTLIPVQQDLELAAAGIRNLRASLETIATLLATGRVTEAKAMVDALVFLIKDPEPKKAVDA